MVVLPLNVILAPVETVTVPLVAIDVALETVTF